VRLLSRLLTFVRERPGELPEVGQGGFTQPMHRVLEVGRVHGLMR